MVYQKIREYLENNGIQQAFLARKAGMTKAAISSSLRGERNLTAEEYLDICHALGVSVDTFDDKKLTCHPQEAVA